MTEFGVLPQMVRPDVVASLSAAVAVAETDVPELEDSAGVLG